MEEIAVIGNFGYTGATLNGQTMRTRSIYKLLKKKLKEYEIKYIDTSEAHTIGKSIIILIKIIIQCIKSDKIIIMPAQKMIKYLLPLLHVINKINLTEIHFVAIGGWIPDFFRKNSNYIKYLSNIKYVYVQMDEMKKKLAELNIKNTVLFPNFRFYEENDKVFFHEKKKIHNFVMYSRVKKEKGINLAVDAIKQIRNNGVGNISLDIYGPIDKAYAEEFDKIINKYNFVSYKGVLNPKRVLNTLCSYDVLLFPTYYEGEGFPGTILDSINAGLPIIASDWNYNSDLIDYNETGLLFKAKNIYDLKEKIYTVIDNPSLRNSMSKNCIKKSQLYDVDNVGSILINKLVNE